MCTSVKVCVEIAGFGGEGGWGGLFRINLNSALSPTS